MPLTRPQERTEALLRYHEGLRLRPYTDTTGHLTIGYGRNLTDVGISLEEARMLLRADLAAAEAAVLDAFPWAAHLDQVRQAVLVDMTFNLGIVTLKRFTTTLAHLQFGRWDQAAAAMLDSRWASQVGQRAKNLAAMVRTGTWPSFTVDLES